MYAQQPSGPPDSSHSVDPHDQALQEYLRINPNLRMIQGRDGRVVAIEDPRRLRMGRGNMPVEMDRPLHMDFLSFTDIMTLIINYLPFLSLVFVSHMMK